MIGEFDTSQTKWMKLLILKTALWLLLHFNYTEPVEEHYKDLNI